MPKSGHHWGKWIVDRSQAVGFKRRSDIARLVGCSMDQLSRWTAMEKPPAKMRKGFDRKLAQALQTTHRMLFVDYVANHPRTTFGIGNVEETMRDPMEPDPDGLFRAHDILSRIVGSLLPPEDQKVAEYAIAIVLAKGDSRRDQFKRYSNDLFPTAKQKSKS